MVFSRGETTRRIMILTVAGTFTADHYAYTDPQSGYNGDSWISKKVPGYMVKFTGTSAKNNATSSGELAQIENGVTTVLGSY
jgi:hypothetical protein